MKVFLDKEGTSPEWESFRDGEHIETRQFIELPSDTDLTNKIVAGGVLRDMTGEEIADIAQADAIAEFKAARPAVIQGIKVTVDDMVFDGDEVSQTRMARAILAMNDGESTTWVLADNTTVTVTRAQLKAALRLSGEAQTAAWVFS